MKNLFYQGQGRLSLHENYAKKGSIEMKAQIKSRSEILIHAHIEEVWEIVINISNWISFCPNFTNVKLEKELRLDKNFTFSLNKIPIKATFARIEPLRELSWTGTSYGSKLSTGLP